MDHANPFRSPTAVGLLRAEYALALGICLVLLIWQLDAVRWVPAVVAFLAIDLVGYLPGLLAHRRSGGAVLARVYPVLYNATHSFLTQAVVIGLWAWLAGFEWAMLAIPIHLCGDRAIFGNFMKPLDLPFEPVSAAAGVRCGQLTA